MRRIAALSDSKQADRGCAKHRQDPPRPFEQRGQTAGTGTVAIGTLAWASRSVTARALGLLP